jgi:hypothetical protein
MLTSRRLRANCDMPRISVDRRARHAIRDEARRAILSKFPADGPSDFPQAASHGESG